MGRHSAGAWTVGECLRIELSYFLKHGFIRKGYQISFSLNWTDQHGRFTASADFGSFLLRLTLILRESVLDELSKPAS